MVIPSLDKPLIGAALECEEQKKEAKLRFPGSRLREKSMRSPGLRRKGQSAEGSGLARQR